MQTLLRERVAAPVGAQRRPKRDPQSQSHLNNALKLQRSIGNRAVGRLLRATGTSIVVQRMKIVKDDGSSQRVLFSEGEDLPDLEGLYHNDGYYYDRPEGAGTGGTYYRRRLISYQRGVGPPSIVGVGAHLESYGTGSVKEKGGAITSNPSKYFPQEAGVDKTTYGLREGYSRLIGPEDLELGDVGGTLSTAREKVESLKTTTTTSLRSVGSSVMSTLESQIKGGEGTTYAEERSIRQPLTSEKGGGEDPRVSHYLAMHQTASLGSTGLSLVASKLSGGITSMVQKGVSATGKAALAKELADEASSLSKAIGETHTTSERSASAPEALIQALATLAEHYGGNSVLDVLKAIPFYVGSIVSGLHTAKRTFSGVGESAEEACEVIQRFAKSGHPSALKVADWLGIPPEVMMAEGGVKVMQTRL